MGGLIDPASVRPDHRGYLRCPYGCHTSASNFPAPRWKTLAGLTKHMDACAWRPPEEWKPPPPPEPVYWGDCPACGDAIFEGEGIWRVGKYALCCSCRDNPQGVGGYLDCAGLNLPGFGDFVG